METKISFERDLAAKASTFYERYDGKYIAEDHATNEKLLSERLEKWCLVSSRGQAKEFERRLNWDDMNLETIRPYLGKVCLPSDAPCPEWASFFNEFVEHADTFCFDLNNPPEYLLKDQPLPFEGFFIPLISFAETRLRSLSGKSLDLLSPRALNRLKGALLMQLVKHSWKTLSVEYTVFRSREASSVFNLIRRSRGADNNILLKEFICYLTKPSNLKSFYLEYAVLARITSTLVANWLVSNSIFLKRLDEDWECIVKEFQVPVSSKEVCELNINLSDPHNGGKSVVVVTFDNGRRVLYKPRCIEVESGFFSFLDWINKHSNLPELKVLKIISREGYGWVEFAEHASCKRVEEVNLYYQRAGILLCLIYILEGNDFHFENIIASGEHPVLIDLETLFCPVSKTETDTGMPQVRWKAFEQMQTSVLKSGFLPNWKLRSDGSAYDTSALGGTENWNSIYRRQDIVQSDSGNYEVRQVAGKIGLKKNVVRLNDVIQKPIDYLDHIQMGFEATYLFLLNNKEKVQAMVKIIFGRKSSDIRVLFLSTMFYDLVARQAGTFSNLRDGADWSIELDRIASRMNRQEQRSSKWPVIRAEHDAMVNMDIPYFKVRSDSINLFTSSGEQTEIFSMTGFNAVLKKIREMSEEDLKIQINLIRASIIARSANGIDRSSSGVTLHLPQEKESLEKTVLTDQALNVANSIRDQSIIADDGAASWIALDYDHNAERYQLVPVRSGLYSGNAGIALFLAHASRIDNSLSELVLQTLQPIIKTIQSKPESIVYDEGLGGATGAGSIIYSLVSVGQVMNNTSLIEEANAMASIITGDLIENDQIFDVVGGCAGALLGLSKLYAVTKSNAVLEAMKQCGYHLLKNMVKASENGYGWKIGIHQPLTGFSHGAGGIAYALSVLNKHIGDKKIATAVEQAVQFERDVFNKEAMNWPDFRNKINPGSDNFMTTWCHGASGIGLSRLGIYENMPDDSYLEEIDQAVETTLRFGIGGIDHLCCGNLGRMELLLHAGLKLNRPALINDAEMLTRMVVERAVKNNSFNIIRGIQGGANSPGFFSGLSGIGYQLLRITNPASYPSVLLWE